MCVNSCCLVRSMLGVAQRCRRVSFTFALLVQPLFARFDFNAPTIDFMSSGAGILLEEYALDQNAARFGLMVTLPIIFCISVVSCLV